MKRNFYLPRGFMLFAFLLFAGGSAFAQSKTVQGIITDAAGPVAGATVIVQGTTTGTVTGDDGLYSVRVSGDQAVLEIGSLGYGTVTVVVGDRTSIDVVLQHSTEAIDDVVVIGYGSVRRRDLTGAVSSVTGKTLANAPVANVAQALQGKLAGVNVTSQDGRPNATVSIRVRGGGSISQSNEPLVLVDGIPGSINDVPSDLVQSIDVLKDASSTAIYGARGANGVVLVTTKRAQQGRAIVSYNGYVRFNTPTGYTEALKPYDYLALKWGILDAYGNNTAPFEQLFGIGEFTGGNSRGIDAYKNVPAYDLQKQAYKSSISHNHDLSVSGGSDKTKILFSLSYTDDQGMKLNSYFKRAVASLKVNQKIAKSLSFDLDLRYGDRRVMGNEGTTNGVGSILSSSYRFRPIALDDMLGDKSMIDAALFGSEDKTTMYDSWSNVNRIRDVQNLAKTQFIRGMAGVNWNIVEGLTFRSELSLNRNWTQDQNWSGPTSNDNYLRSTGTHTNAERTILYAGDVDYRKRDNWGLRWANTLTYDVTLREIHRLNFMIGQEVSNSGGSDMRIQARRFPSQYTKETAFAMINQGDRSDNANLLVSSAPPDSERTMSWFGRINYSLLDRYLFTFTMRADGSSKFAPSNRWGYFPAGAVAWRISEEPFLRDVSWMDDLKLRFSYGSVGNDAIDPSLWTQLWSSVTDVRFNAGLGNMPQAGYDLGTIYANPNLKWETTITRNLGLDFSLFAGRLWGSFDLYWNTTRDLLMLTDIQGGSGFPTTMDNIGQTSNKGIEFAVNGTIFQNRDWNISAGVNVSFNKNNIDKLAGNVPGTYGSQFLQSGIPGTDYRLIEGKPVGIVYGYKMDGVGYYTTDDFDYDAATGTYTLKAGIPDLATDLTFTPGGVRPGRQQAYPGAPKFVNANGDNVIDTNDFVEIGNMSPKSTGGFNVTATYRGIDLGLYFNWSYGNQIYNAHKLASLYHITKGGGLFGNKMEIVKESYQYYTIENGELERVVEPAALTALNRNATLPSTQLQQGYPSDLGIEDGSYLRLNTVTLGYTLPKKITEKARISNLRIYGTIYNVFTITGYSGLDPEVNTNLELNNARYPTIGLDWGAYPRARQYVIGLNLSF